MKICLVGPGIMKIPSAGWGAVEILIWDYYNELKRLGIDVDIINKMRRNGLEQNTTNSNYCQELIEQINKGHYDFVHIHYDCLYHIMPFLKCGKVGLTSHYPYIDNIMKHRRDGYTRIFHNMIENDFYYNFVLAEKDIKFLKASGANEKHLYKLDNIIGGNFKTCNNGNKSDQTIYLGKIDQRKRQYKYQSIKSIHFVGPINCAQFKRNENYLGSWSRNEVENNLCQYGNLLLLSEGEADPLVVKEALKCGIGVVVNETSGSNLDKNKPFITIIPNNKLDDINYIEKRLQENRDASKTMTDDILNYYENNFNSLNNVEKYLKLITD